MRKSSTGAALLLGMLSLPVGAAPPLELGRNLAATCASCHGTNGRAREGMAALAGLPAALLMRSLQEFRSGQRPATVMHHLARGYTEEQIRLIAEHFAGQEASR